MNFINNPDYKKIFSFHATIRGRVIARESGWLEFKESFNWLNKDKYAKSMAAFANNKGGYIVFGIKNQPRELTGLKNNIFEITDESNITTYLNDVFSPEIIFEKLVIEVQSKNIGILHTYQAKNKPVICLKNSGNLKESDIYYRYNAKSEKIKYPELKSLLDQIKTEQDNIWRKHLERISIIGPENATIFDISGGGIIKQNSTLAIDKKLISKLKFIKKGDFQENGKPVLKLIDEVKPISVVIGKNNKKSINNVDFQITNDSSAPVIRLKEEEILDKRYPLIYKTLTEELRKRYTDFKINNKYHKLRKKFEKDKKLCRTRYLDPNNTRGSKKDFYNPLIYKEFDRHYTKKSNNALF